MFINTKQFLNAKASFINCIIAVLLFSLLITSSFFVNTFYTNFFLYLIVASIIIFFIGFLTVKQINLKLSQTALISFYIVISWCIYILFNDNFINITGEKFKSTYLLVSFLLYISITLLLVNFPNSKRNVFIFLCIVSAVQSIWCFLQFAEILGTNNSDIKVTGSWVNPNITAMFLALVIPFVFINVLSKPNAKRKLYVLLFVLMLLALLLLKCRTAILGAIISILILVEYHYKLCRKYIDKYSRTRIVATTVLLASIITLSCFYIYNVKKESADGRKLIWSLSLKMILQKPIFGFGYGGFERNYNLHQANYFSNIMDNENEIVNASHTPMAYNEIIENTIEGGVFGGVFFVAFIGILLFSGIRYMRNQKLKVANKPIKPKPETQEKISDSQIVLAALVGIVLLLFMSFINFTITAVPIFCILVLFASIVILAESDDNKKVHIPILANKILSSLLILIGAALLYKNTIEAYYQTKISTAITFAKERQYDEAFTQLGMIPIKNQKNVNFYQTLGNLYNSNNQKKEALVVYQKSILFYSSPLLYQQIGDCFLAQKEYPKAIANYEIAKNIQPNRFTPRYLLFKLYIENKSRVNAIKCANEIIEMDEKIPSSKTNEIKQLAKTYIKKVNNEHDYKAY